MFIFGYGRTALIAFLGRTFALVERETAGAGPPSVFARVRLASVEAGSLARA